MRMEQEDSDEEVDSPAAARNVPETDEKTDQLELSNDKGSSVQDQAAM